VKIPERIRIIARRYDIKRKWYRFRRSPLSVIGLVIAGGAIFLALAAPFITPYPGQAGLQTNLPQRFLPPSLTYIFGTDQLGRDVFTRTIFGFQYSLMMAVVVLALVVPPGVVLGLIAGYYRSTWIDMVIMRISDIFIAVPPLVLALSIASVLTPSIFNAMMAVSLMWWPWYTRLTYNAVSTVRNEYFVQASEVMGASSFRIMFSDILPNCLGSILTKITLDVGWVILLGSALSFVGLGAQPPTPDLGTMVAQGGQYLPGQWWISMFPALAICLIILGFNILGDGIRDIFVEEVR
jgi:peptide/nickel transport system permease protein